MTALGAATVRAADPPLAATKGRPPGNHESANLRGGPSSFGIRPAVSPGFAPPRNNLYPSQAPFSPGTVRTGISSCLPLPVENCTFAQPYQNAVSHPLPTYPPPFAHRLKERSVGR